MSTTLVLRTCKADMTSNMGWFAWPTSGPVECSDWLPTPECGNGLHGFLWGEGNGSLADWSKDAKWLVVEVEADQVVDLGGKAKFPRGAVVFCGDRKAATDYIIAHGAAGRAVIGATVAACDYGTATAGDYGTATAGNCGTVCLRWWDGNRYRLAVGYIGEDGLLPNVPYKVENGKLVDAREAKQ